MWNFAVNLSKYFGVVFALALVLEYLISRKTADVFAEKLIDFSGVLKKENIDANIARLAGNIRDKFGSIYGERYFGKQQIVISSLLVFTYCVLFALIEDHYIGFESPITKQLKFWFVPSLVADMCSVNFTRWLLKKTADNPNQYALHLVIDLIVVILFFYASYSIAMLVLFFEYPELGVARIVLHPFYMVWFAISLNHNPMVASIKLTLIMALTTLIPTFVHFVFISFGLFSRYNLPWFTRGSDFFVDRIISYHMIAIQLQHLQSWLVFLHRLYLSIFNCGKQNDITTP